MFLKQSTVQTIMLGPFVDSTDGSTVEDSLVITPALRKISKNGGTFVESSQTGDMSYKGDGFYSHSLHADDTNTVGSLKIQVNVSGALPVWEDFYVVEESIYDSLFAASAAGFDANQRVSVGAFLSSLDLTTTMKNSVNAQADTALTDYGALKPSSPGRDLDVTSNGNAGVDWGNVENPTTSVSLSGTTVGTSTNITQIAGVAAATQIINQAKLALAFYNLDHLLHTGALASDVANSSVIARMCSSSGTPDFTSFLNTSDSLQAIRDFALDLVTGAAVTESGDLTINWGDTYHDDSLQLLELESSGWINLTGLNVTFKVRSNDNLDNFQFDVEKTAEGVTTQKVQVDMTRAETKAFRVGADIYEYDLDIDTAGKERTLQSGKLTVVKDN